MSNENFLVNIIEYLTDSFRRHFWLWLLPTILVGGLGTNYAMLKSDKWLASQSLHVRDEIVAGQNGRFNNNDERKFAQETIIGLAGSRTVVSSALKKIGPPQNFISLGSWPTTGHVESVQENVSVSAPKGSEIGGTEVVRLNVVAKDPDRAIELNRAILESTIARLQVLRESKGISVIAELEQKLAVAEENLKTANLRLERMEKEIGPDLGELRTLDRLGTGESNLRTALTQIKNDLRLANRKQTELRELERILIESRSNTEKLVATPSSLLGSLSAIRQLRDGLVVAQLKLADMSGKMSPRHPEVRAAVQAEKEVRRQIKLEIPSAIKAVAAEQEVNQALTKSLQHELQEVQDRMRQLATLRTPYSNLVNQVNAYTEQHRLAQEALDTARARQNSFHKSSLISPIGDVEISDSPVGPRRAVIAAASCVGGFLIGAGLVFLASPLTFVESQPSIFRGRRASDRPSQPIQFGRRATDQPTNEYLASQRRQSGSLELTDSASG